MVRSRCIQGSLERVPVEGDAAVSVVAEAQFVTERGNAPGHPPTVPYARATAAWNEAPSLR